MLDLTTLRVGDTIKIWAYRNGDKTPTVSKGKVEQIRDTEAEPLSFHSRYKIRPNLERSRYLITVSGTRKKFFFRRETVYRSYYSDFLFARKLRWYEKLWELFF